MKAGRIRIFAVAMVFGGALGFARLSAGQLDASTSVQMQPSGDQGAKNAASAPVFERKFVQKAIESSLGDIAMARLALEKSTDADVRHFAIQETDDHGKILDDLKQVAQQLKMTPPDAPSKSAQKDLEKLKGLSGHAFDQAFLKETVKSHKEEDRSYKDEGRATTSPQLKKLISQEDQILGNHLQQAEQLAQTNGKE